MTSRVIAVALDCRDVEVLSAFWCAALGSTVLARWCDAKGKEYVEVGLGDGVQNAALLLQPVDENKSGKNRMHLDLTPTNTTQADEIARLVSLGAAELARDPHQPWVVLADPEGNEFCVLPPRGVRE
ncbi:MAG TPA: VOC family protein [Pseudonocardiaceae bacterium]|nr:VOC family protein [Pseudonocardiaceae bacterium]